MQGERGAGAGPRSVGGRLGGDKGALLVPLHVPDAADGLDLGLEGAPLVPVPEVPGLKEVLVAAVPGVLIPDPAAGRADGALSAVPKPPFSLPGAPRCSPSLRSTGHLHAAHTVAKAISPEAGHVVLLDVHLVALEVSRLVQGDLVVLGLLGGTAALGWADGARSTWGAEHSPFGWDAWT